LSWLPQAAQRRGNNEMNKLMRKWLNQTRAAAQRFHADERGVAAIEFCFIVPLLITIWLGTMEISQGIEVNKKVGRASSVIGDLITQEEVQTVAQVQDIMNIGAAVLQPYDRDVPTITVTEIYVDSALAAKVKWSRRGTGSSFSTPFALDTPVTDLPANLKIADTYLVRVETKLKYLPITSWTIKKNQTGSNGQYASVAMKEIYYLRPRQGTDVKCTGC
jgi:Flp pilus assembly protein TadG